MNIVKIRDIEDKFQGISTYRLSEDIHYDFD